MRGRALLIVGCAIVAISALIAHGVVYWTPWFGARNNFGIGGLFETANTRGLTYRPYSHVEAVDDINKLSIKEFNDRVENLFNHLTGLTEEELILAIASDEKFCESNVFHCYGLPLKVAKPFGERALAYKQRLQTIEYTEASMITSRAGVAISFLALLLSAASFTVALLNYRRGSSMGHTTTSRGN
jgi:hypothetical protein